jgi:hypothetical protein
MQLNGTKESYALLQISANPPPIDAFAGLGTHALAFAGEVELSPTFDMVKDLKEDLDDIDFPFSWDLDIIVGPKWRSVKQAAPLVAVTNVHSGNADADDHFEFACNFRNPKWSVQNLAGHERIVLHVTITQAGEYLLLYRLQYTVTATGNLRDAAGLVP